MTTNLSTTLASPALPPTDPQWCLPTDPIPRCVLVQRSHGSYILHPTHLQPLFPAQHPQRGNPAERILFPTTVCVWVHLTTHGYDHGPHSTDSAACKPHNVVYMLHCPHPHLLFSAPQLPQWRSPSTRVLCPIPLWVGRHFECHLCARFFQFLYSSHRTI